MICGKDMEPRLMVFGRKGNQPFDIVGVYLYMSGCQLPNCGWESKTSEVKKQKQKQTKKNKKH